MKAAVLHSLGDIPRYEDFPAPVAAEGEAIVQVTAASRAKLQDISLPAAVLRSSAVTILGTAGIPPREVLLSALAKVMELGAAGKLRIEIQRMPLSEVAAAWTSDASGRRIVFVP